ncbi:mitochondrial ribosomal protein S25-domain-containing protein [Mrakia frigida]|uniref:mitochondrial 37S ribosomal protein mS23 RSM25 n=1 Tax=Mrakia frigida TaxID=29902 RepID=UPI003FCC2113
MVRRNSLDVLQSSLRLTSIGVGHTPVWHAAILTHPPAPPLPIQKHSVEPIVFKEDRIRERFFQDFPFEAFRSKTLTERATIADPERIQGKEWWSLGQRTRCPSPEDCIDFCISLNENHNLSISKAYAIATAQFSHLRAIHEIAVRAANREAETYGAQFRGGEINRSAMKSENALRTWVPPRAVGVNAMGDVWSAEPRPSFYALEGKFSGGEAYVHGWKHWNDVTTQRKIYSEERQTPIAE